jgi:5'-3' exonuclease
VDFERFIDDFVFFCIFLGNDFLPNTPGMHIEEGAIDGMFQLYLHFFKETRQHLTSNGRVIWRYAKQFLVKLALLEDEWCVRRNGCLGSEIPTTKPGYKEVFYKAKMMVEDGPELAEMR